MKYLPVLFYIVDIGFIVYWLITLFHLIPGEYLYNNYTNPLLVSWNWSFFPIDILISATGLLSMYLRKRWNFLWIKFALISLILTFATWLMALSYWTINKDFEIQWWLPNLFLLIYPLLYIPKIVFSENK